MRDVLNKRFKHAPTTKPYTKCVKLSGAKQIAPVACIILIVAVVGVHLLGGSHAATPYVISEAESGVLANGATKLSNADAAGGVYVQFNGSGGAPVTPSAEICGDGSVLNGPSTAPSGAVTVAAGDNSSIKLNTANTTYWFAPGTHTLGTSQYSQIDPGQGDTYIGAPGAIISGQGDNDFAFVASYEAPWATDVTIENLTIENFTPPGSQAAVNVNGGSDWSIKNDTIQDNTPGSAMMIGSSDTITDNCLTHNGEYAFNGYLNASYPSASPTTGGPENSTVNDNEISFNDTCNWEAVSPNPVPSASRPGNCGSGEFSGCGCAGGGKFWKAENITLDDNYVHNNYDVGLWEDTDNDGFQVEGNYFANNYSPGLLYEVSYNALIKDNTFYENALGEGPTNPGFPTGAIYISESGGDSRVPNSFNYNTVDITGNVFTDNWSGVVMWENANRFCGDDIIYDEPDSNCTLVDPLVASSDTVCANALENSAENQPTDRPDYFDLCRWKTQNVSVNNNTFNFNASAIGSDCTPSHSCGMNALFSEYGDNVDNTPYIGSIVPTNITFNQNNVFSDNTYNGPWSFFAWSQGNPDNPISFSQWAAAVTDKCSSSGEKASGTCNSGFGQDAGSKYN